MENYAAIKRNKILPFAATWMDLEGIMLSEMSDRERQILYDITYHLYVESKKYNKLVNITKKKQTHRYREQTSGYPSGKGRGRGNIGVSVKQGLWDYMKSHV